VLERTDESQFRAGSPIRAIGGRAAYSPAIIESARRVLEDLMTAARTSAGLGVLAGSQVAYIEKRNDHSPVTTFARAPKLPAHATALGKALLAFSCPDLQRQVIAEGLPRYTRQTLTDPDQLRHVLSVIRLTRFAVSRSEYRDGTSAVAVPVFGSGGSVIAALGLSVPDLRSDLHLARSVLTVAARGLSRELTVGTNTCSFTIGVEQQPVQVG
jgi:DNA-binding IclR family transcriptional regulator